VLLPILSRQPVGARSFRTILIFATMGHVVYGIGWAIVLWWNSELLIRVLFQASYLDAVPLLQIMSLIPLIKGVNFCTTLIMVARDQQVFRTKLLSVGAIFNVTANLIGIPLFGLVGAAWVNLATEVVLLVCYGYGAWRTIRRLA
jgi:O-antigen/teichoic acid export membrane protein